ncbi:putative metal-binding motif-containing protein [Corallococcus aberystwythensis]|uniref:Lipoprotein n=1 Tax=Corallococcus aberystwythensis TaxID=2316722 RepID=A0A3A8P663_9BACT|nr:putative metal-binding motif-containing protein [Corallococcus aberystwythensis]RKH52006.1 hypothetical protein D7W81_40145 [Corallococcus aberystwythensis]
MRRLCVLGCVVLLAACRTKEPAEGVLRVTVKYVAQEPRCVRVEIGDGVHRVQTDVPSSEFQDPGAREFRLAMVRKADWNRVLNLTATSFSEVSGTKCAGTIVEVRHNRSLDVPPGASADWSVTLQARDADGDGYFVEAPETEKPDCDDSNSNVHPGATEACDSRVDLNCNQRVGCQEAGCGGQSCDDGDACTTGDHCKGSGLEAQCLPSQTTKCTQPTGICDAPQACNPNTGLCEATASTVGKSCDDGNLCTDGDACGANGLCAGTPRSCTTTGQCVENQGTCNTATGDCVFTSRPDTTACQDPLTCTTGDHCDGNGNCVGTPGTCAPPSCHRVKQQCTASTQCEYEVDLNAACTAPGGVPGVCLATTECSAFPYQPSNFNPNAVAVDDIGALRTNANVVFDTADQSWTPSGAVTTLASLHILTIAQGAGNPPALLIPVRTLELNGSLTIKGPAPVILAVYGDATVNQSILATGSIVNPNPACGASQGTAGTFGTDTGGGGGGGGNATAGGNGGKGYDNDQPQGGAGVLRPSISEPLLGGCPGGNGGGTGPAAGGKGGAGGGGVQLSVARTLTLSTKVSASGDGGEGGKAASGKGAGGGGGGSGGRVVLEAFQLALTSSARVTANGGGGGEGSSTTNNTGRNGANGSQDSGLQASGGNAGSSTAGDGGDGGASMFTPGTGEDGERDAFGTEGAGGGGGGAAGFIHLRSVQSCSIGSGALISPAPTGGCVKP